MKTGLESLEIGAPKITYSGNEGPKPPQQMAMADPLLVEEYQKYVFEMEEQGLTPMSFEEFKLQAMSGMAEGGRVPAAFGGIMDSATGRKRYFGGSFFSSITRPIEKIVKTVAKPIKKIAKSPIGKAALMAAAAYYAPQFAGRYFPKANPSSFMGKLAAGKDLAFMDRMKATGSAFKTLLPGGTTPGGGISKLKIPFLSGTTETSYSAADQLAKMAQDKANLALLDPGIPTETFATQLAELGANVTPKAISTAKETVKPSLLKTAAYIGVPSTIAGMYTAAQPKESLDDTVETASTGPSIKDVTGGLSLDEIAKLAQLNKLDSDYRFMGLPDTRLYLANGGRIGYDDGGLSSLRSAALTELYKTNDEEEDKKLAFGGSAGLPPITAGIEGQVSQSFPDDETPAPTQQDQMPRPMMNPMMARQMNPMMARQMNPMMSMQPRMMAQDGGIMMASYDYNDAMIESFEAYQKAIKDGIIPPTMEFDEYLELMQGKKETAPRVMAQEGGLMDMGGMEKDYRNEGGFVPIGAKERAADVPARLSKNEFVFTAEAVRNAGGGDIDKGAEIMENMMENLEQGGKVSEESQGLKGARAMFATQQRLGEVL